MIIDRETPRDPKDVAEWLLAFGPHDDNSASAVACSVLHTAAWQVEQMGKRIADLEDRLNKAMHSARQLCGAHSDIAFHMCPQCWGEDQEKMARELREKVADQAAEIEMLKTNAEGRVHDPHDSMADLYDEVVAERDLAQTRAGLNEGLAIRLQLKLDDATAQIQQMKHERLTQGAPGSDLQVAADKACQGASIGPGVVARPSHLRELRELLDSHKDALDYYRNTEAKIRRALEEADGGS